ncbi:hypothetical protein FIBSPDRAFT_67677 [Athelia psychrophila]|uniref:Uncharacterized protein n=1 Tax=Athelia psychrophila TaxID=1759441 RepID=A0A166EVC5_9AGAM|nr:hypothetical protein FIBSPDRAFT_67677 [Fibularhizoctonia sp. CBS 109695]
MFARCQGAGMTSECGRWCLGSDTSQKSAETHTSTHECTNSKGQGVKPRGCTTSARLSIPDPEAERWNAWTSDPRIYRSCAIRTAFESSGTCSARLEPRSRRGGLRIDAAAGDGQGPRSVRWSIGCYPQIGRRWSQSHGRAQAERSIQLNHTSVAMGVRPGCGLWVAGCGLRVAGCGLRVAGCGLRTVRLGCACSERWLGDGYECSWRGILPLATDMTAGDGYEI